MDKYYQDANKMPYSNYADIVDKQDFESIKIIKDDKKVCEICSLVAFDKVNKSIIKHFGYGEKYVKIINKRAKIESLYAEMITTGDKFIQNMIDIQEAELEALTKEDTEIKKQTACELFYDLENILNRNLDADKETVISFMTKRNMAYEQQKKLAEENKKAQKQYK